MSNRYHIKKFYAHWVVDFIIPLLYIPKPIRDSVPIIVSHGILPSILQMMDVIGIMENRIIPFSKTCNYMYVDKVYTIIAGDVANRFYGEPMKYAKLFFMEKLNLSRSKPTNYIFQNRNKGESRYIANMDELFNITVAMYPQYNWKFDNSSNYNLLFVLLAQLVRILPMFYSCNQIP